MAAATACPCAAATSKCSMRARRPCSSESYSHMSPAAHTPAADVARSAPQASPPLSPSSSPAARPSITSGIALEALQAVARDELDAAPAQQVAEERARRSPELRRQRGVLQHDHGAAAP